MTSRPRDPARPQTIEVQAGLVELQAESAVLQTTWSRLRDSRDPFADLVRVAHDAAKLECLVEERTAALRDSEARLRTIVETAADGILVVDEHGTVEIMNPAAERMFGHATGAMVGRSVTEILGVDFAAGARAAPTRSAPGAAPAPAGAHVEVEGRRKDGTAVPLEVACSEFTVRGQRRFVGVIRDITERRLFLEKLRRSEEIFRAFVLASSDVVYRMAPDWSEMRELVGRDFIADTAEPDRAWSSKYILPEDQPRVMAAIAEAIRRKQSFELQHRVRRVDGSVGWMWSRAIALRDPRGEITEWIGTARDVTERREHEIRLAAAAEEERRRIARDLHDDLGQQLTTLLYATELLARDLAGRPEAERAAELRRLTRHVFDGMREVSRELYPVPLTLDGLTSALEDLADRVDGERPRCVFVASSGVIVSDPTVATHLFRIAQEAVSNAVKHSGAQRIEIRLEPRDALVDLSVRDNGVGLPPAAAGGRSRGLGMQTMRDRARLIGGELSVTTGEGGGTIVRCSLRLPGPVAPERRSAAA